MNTSEVEVTNATSTNFNKSTGIVKWFNGSKGFGFIKNVKNNDEIFVHHSNLVVDEDCWKTLIQGEYVEYDVDSASEGRTQATTVTGINGGPLLCESNKNNNLNIIRNKWKKNTGETTGDNTDETTATEVN